MNRAYSELIVKALEDERRIIRGTATTPRPDRMGDIVEPLGVKFKNPMPLLHHHRADEPVGIVKFAKPTEDGIEFEAQLPRIDEPASLRERIDTAWGEIKAGLVRAVSIGFRPIDGAIEMIKDGGLRFLKSEILELSLVVIPANADARILEFKQFDIGLDADHLSEVQATRPAALGRKDRGAVGLIPPGGSGLLKPNPKLRIIP